MPLLVWLFFFLSFAFFLHSLWGAMTKGVIFTGAARCTKSDSKIYFYFTVVVHIFV